MGLTLASRIAMYTTVFLACVSFSIVLPTIWPYLSTFRASPNFLALVLATYSIGEAFGAVFFGSLCTRYSMRTLMLTSNFVGILGAFLYLVARILALNWTARWSIFFGRTLLGIWTGAAQSLQQTYFAEVVEKNEVTAAVVTISAYASLGFVTGPVLAYACTAFSNVHIATWVIDPISIPAFFVFFSSLLCFALYAFVFDEHNDRSLAHLHSSSHLPHAIPVGVPIPLTEDELQPMLHPRVETTSKSCSEYMAQAVFCNFAFFVHFLAFAFQETITTYVSFSSIFHPFTRIVFICPGEYL